MSDQSVTGLRLALDLTDFGARLREQRFRRENPEVDEPTIQRLMDEWWRVRPGAPYGDAVGRIVPVTLPNG